MNKVPMTLSGAQNLRQELEQLVNIERPRIIEAIATAREHGDLKENAEYHSAREEQGFIEGRIKNIEAKLSIAEIIDVTKVNANGRVVFGSTVVIFDEDSEKNISYCIVGEDEADIEKNLLSYISPIARALIGKELGNIVTIKVPGGERSCKVVEIYYRHIAD